LTKEEKAPKKEEQKPTESKPKKLTAPGTKPQTVPSNVVQQDLLDMDTPTTNTTTTNNTNNNNNNNVFAWDNVPVSQPQQQTQQTQQNQNCKDHSLISNLFRELGKCQQAHYYSTNYQQQ